MNPQQEQNQQILSSQLRRENDWPNREDMLYYIYAHWYRLDRITRINLFHEVWRRIARLRQSLYRK